MAAAEEAAARVYTYAFHELMIIALAGVSALWLAWQVVQATWLRGEPMAAFRLRYGQWAGWVGGGIGVLACLGLVASGAWLESGFNVAAWVSSLLALGVAWWARVRVEPSVERALELAREESPFVRVRVYEAYLAAYPGDSRVLEALLEEPTALQLISDLDQRGTRWGDRLIGDAAVERLAAADAARIVAALGRGVFSHRPELLARLTELARGAAEREQTSILERSGGARRAGEQLRRLLEDALVYPLLELELAIVEGPRLERQGRLALAALGNLLEEHFGRVHIAVRRVVGEEGGEVGGVPRWQLRLEVLEYHEHPTEWEEIEVRRSEEPQPTGFGRSQPTPRFTTTPQVLTVTRRGVYPGLRLRATLLRDGREVATADAESSAGLLRIKRSSLKKQGFAAPRSAAETLQTGLLRGLALHILDDAPALGAAAPAQPAHRAATPEEAAPEEAAEAAAVVTAQRGGG